MKRIIYLVLISIGIATTAVAQQADEDVRRAEILSRYDQLLGFAEVCVTDPCPVKRVEVTILGHKFDAVRVELPGRRIDYIVVENDVGIRSLWGCEPENLVEIDPDWECNQLA